MAIKPAVGDVVSFQYVQNGVIGDPQSGVKVVVDRMTLEAARGIDPQVVTKHTNLFPYFKDAVKGVDDPNAYYYFAIQLPNGTLQVVGVPWVNEATFKIINARTRTYVLTNFDASMEAPLHRFLEDIKATYTFSEVSK